MNEPLVSLILLSYNYARFIGDAIRSILAQTYPHWELLVIDDASTDSSVDVIRSFNDPRLRLLRLESNLGASAAYNLAYASCRGQYVGSIDADDFLAPRKLELQLEEFAIHSDLDVLGTFVTEVDAAGNTVDGETAAWFNQNLDFDDVENWLMENHLCHSSVLLKRSAHDRFGGLNPHLHVAADFELWLRALAQGARFRVLPEQLLFSRQHESNAWNQIGPGHLFLEFAYLFSAHLAPHLVERRRTELFEPCLSFFTGHFLATDDDGARGAAVAELLNFALHPRDFAGFAAAFERGCGPHWPAILDAIGRTARDRAEGEGTDDQTVKQELLAAAAERDRRWQRLQAMLSGRLAREHDLLYVIGRRDTQLSEMHAALAAQREREQDLRREVDDRDALLLQVKTSLADETERYQSVLSEAAAANSKLAAVGTELERISAELDTLHSSKSWRLVTLAWRLRARLRLGARGPKAPPQRPRLGVAVWRAARLAYRLLPISGRRRGQLRRNLLAWLSVPDEVAPELAVERLRDLVQALTWRRVGSAVKLLLRGNLPALRMHANLLVQHTVNQQTREAAFLEAPGEFVVLDPQPWPADEPLVSVIIPCYNYGHFVAEAVDSVLAQTFRNFEILVVDGGSEPSSLAHLKDLRRPQTRIFFREGRHFVGDNRNYGIALARGKYVCCLDADDRIQPTYLEKALFILETQDYDLVSCSFRCFGDSSAIYHLERHPTLADMLKGNQVSTCAVFRKQLWSRAGGFQDAGIGGDYIYEDWRLWVRCAALGARFANIVDEPLLWYRVHSAGSLSSQNQAVPPMDRQRQAMADFNRDVLTEEAHRQSEENRRRQVRMHDGLVNLKSGWPASPADAPVILIAMPFLVVGGAERLLSAVAGHLARRGFRIVVVTTEYVYPTYGDATPWFAAVTSEVYHLPRFLEPGRWQEFIFYLLETRRPALLWIIGSRVFYELLPKVKQCYPALPVIDLLFNTVGHTASNRKHARYFDRILVENGEVAAWLEKAGEQPERVRQIPSGVDLAEYRPAAGPRRLPVELDIPAGSFLVGYSGRLSEEKDPDTFLDIARYSRSDPRLVFLMTGAGPQAEQIQKRVEKMALGNRLHFLGQVEEVKPFMAAYDVLVLPSKFDGRPVAVLESLALGVPVVASRVGALPELIEDGVNGFLCEPGDAAGFAERIRWLADHPQEHRRMKAAARKFAEAALGADPMFAAYEQAIRELIEPRRLTLAV